MTDPEKATSTQPGREGRIEEKVLREGSFPRAQD
jgi:hypothetical protein